MVGLDAEEGEPTRVAADKGVGEVL
jgi:hypothetical protein